jgi:hypothetical protein
VRYILVANNTEIDDEISNLKRGDEDRLILFNFMKPFFKYEIVREFTDMVVFSRKRSNRTEPLNTVYAGIELIKENEHKFRQVVFHRNPNSYSGNIKKACLDSLSHFGFLDSPKTKYIDDKGFREAAHIKSKKSLSSGLIAYIHIRTHKKPQDKIVLVGFTNKVAKKYHDPDAEREFFEGEIRAGNCSTLKSLPDHDGN